MDRQELLNGLIGNWSGEMVTYLQPDQESSRGLSIGYIRYRMDRHAIEMEYTYDMQDTEHNALLLFPLTEQMDATWIDTYHTQGEIMPLAGKIDQDKLVFEGKYEGGGDTWGWKIELFTNADDDVLYFIHYNIPPSGEPYVGVNAEYKSSEENTFLTDFEY